MWMKLLHSYGAAANQNGRAREISDAAHSSEFSPRSLPVSTPARQFTPGLHQRIIVPYHQNEIQALLRGLHPPGAIAPGIQACENRSHQHVCGDIV
jgi:hypothetical protein